MKNWKQPKCWTSGEYLNKACFIYTMKYSADTKNDAVEGHLLTWKHGYTTLLNEKKQLRKLCAPVTPICTWDICVYEQMPDRMHPKILIMVISMCWDWGWTSFSSPGLSVLNVLFIINMNTFCNNTTKQSTALKTKQTNTCHAPWVAAPRKGFQRVKYVHAWSSDDSYLYWVPFICQAQEPNEMGILVSFDRC